jgi:hypothetical protein
MSGDEAFATLMVIVIALGFFGGLLSLIFRNRDDTYVG